MGQKRNILLAFYGDDFTGSTDALEFLTLAGIKTILFLQRPEARDLNRFPDVQAIGVAGKSRSMVPEDMEVELIPAFENLRNFNPDFIHYKVCSTFDSAPHVGSIGKAIDIGTDVFDQKTTFVLPAAPHLGRFCVFGNLFAKMGTVGTGVIYRIDKHPSMSNHPVTPAYEADLTLHLGQQTDKTIELIDLSVIEKGKAAIIEAVKKYEETEILFFDGLNNSHLQTIGHYLNGLVQRKPLFLVGSSGVEMALGLAWKESEVIQDKVEIDALYEAGPILVLSGSCSPVTSDQIEFAVAQGFSEMPLGPDIIKKENQSQIIEHMVKQIIENFNNQQSSILHTSKGPTDSRIKATEEYFKGQGVMENEVQKHCSQSYGKILGMITKKVLEVIPLKRIVFAGGDTSSYAASELNILALEMIAQIAPGAPLCRAISDTEIINGLELNFKGGQVGTTDYFIKVLKGEKL